MKPVGEGGGEKGGERGGVVEFDERLGKRFLVVFEDEGLLLLLLSFTFVFYLSFFHPNNKKKTNKTDEVEENLKNNNLSPSQHETITTFHKLFSNSLSECLLSVDEAIELAEKNQE